MDLDVVTELTSLALDLDTVMEESFEGWAIENTITCRPGEVDSEFVFVGDLSSSGLRL